MISLSGQLDHTLDRNIRETQTICSPIPVICCCQQSFNNVPSHARLHAGSSNQKKNCEQLNGFFPDLKQKLTKHESCRYLHETFTRKPARVTTARRTGWHLTDMPKASSFPTCRPLRKLCPTTASTSTP
ncbi:hypothetical protein MRX96_031892 [Rhipicephalus microplus]